MSEEQKNNGTFTPVDSVARMMADLRAAGYETQESSGGFVVDMSDEEYTAFMAARGYVRD